MRKIGLIDSMPGDFLRVMGKVLAFSSIGLAASIVLGGVALTVGGVLGVIGVAAAAAGCLMGSMAVQRRTIEACYGGLRRPSTPELAGDRSISPEEAAENAAVDRVIEEMEAERAATEKKRFVDLLERQGRVVTSDSKSLH